jgi:hypothetical protein
MPFHLDLVIRMFCFFGFCFPQGCGFLTTLKDTTLKATALFPHFKCPFEIINYLKCFDELTIDIFLSAVCQQINILGLKKVLVKI